MVSMTASTPADSVSEHFDLAIIGSGSGNSIITDSWDDKKVAIIDSGVFGGTCLNKGCIPTKMFVYPATLASTETEHERVNLSNGTRPEVDWPGLRDRIFSRIDAISDAGRRYRDEELDNTTLIAEEVRFTGPKQLTTEAGRVIEADQVVIAAGSRPRALDVPGADLPQIHTSDTIMRIPELPRRVLVLGGGFIAAEFAGIFAGLGAETIQVNRSEALLRDHDDLVSETFTRMAAEQWTVKLNWQVTRFDETADGAVATTFTTETGQEQVIETDLVLCAIGRVPNTDRLTPDAAGLATKANGRILTDEFLRVLDTNGEVLEGVWALGDITNEYQLKHVANHEQRIVNHNMDHPEALKSADQLPVPAAVFSRPQIATVGLTERDAREQFPDEELTVKVQQYKDVAYGWAMGDGEGFVKLIAHRPTGTILGAHILGEDASNLIQPLIQAMSFGVDAHTMARGQYWIHPALAEVVENAVLGLDVPDSGLV